MDYSKFSDETLKALSEGRELDYSKLSNDELNELSKGSTTSTPMMESDPDAPGKTESFLRGAAQGGTFGFADEGTALLESLLSQKSYDQSLAESRANYKAAEEENPLTYMGGTFAGGMAVPLPGAGTASIGKLALQGAGIGALSGLGSSERDLTKGDLTEMKEAGKDVLMGGAIGGTLGAGIGAIGKGLGKAKDFWKDSKYGQDLTDMYNYSKADPNFNTGENLKQTTEGLFTSIKKDYIPMMTTDLGKAVSQRYDDEIAKAAQEGRTVNFEDFRKQVMGALDKVKVQDDNYVRGRKEIEKYLDAVGKVSRETVEAPVSEVDAINKATSKIQDKLGKGKIESDATIRNMAKKYADDIAESNPEVNRAALEEEIFTKIKAAYEKNYNPKIGTEVDPITGEKFVKSESTTPTGRTQIKAEQIIPETTESTVENIGRQELDPETLSEVSKKGQDFFDLFNMGNESTRRNEVLAGAGLKMKEIAKEGTMPSSVQDELAGFRSKMGDIKAQLGVDFGGKGGDDLKRAQIDAAEKIKGMFLRMAKDPGTDQERRLTMAKGIAQELGDAGLVDSQKLEEVTSRLMDLSKREYLMRSAQNESFLATDVTNYVLFPFTARGKSLYLASGAGKAASLAEKTKIPQMSKKFYDFVPEQLDSLAAKLEAKNSTFAPVVRNLVNQPAPKRKALMFTLMQQPAFREILESDDDAQ